MYFRNYRLRKTCLDKCLKDPIWEHLSTGDMVNGAKYWFNLNQRAFIVLSDHCEGNWVAKVTLRHMKILSGPFLNTVTADDKYSLISMRQVNASNFRCIYIKKKKAFCLIYFCVFRLCIKFRTFLKKDHPHSVCIFKITDHERRA